MFVRTIFAVALTVLLSIPARAETVLLTLDEAGEVMVGLSALDGYKDTALVRQPDGREATVIVEKPYKLGDVRWTIQRDIVILRQAVQAGERAKAQQTEEEKKTASTTKQPFDLLLIARAELDVGKQPDKNPIAGTVLAFIDPVLKPDPKPEPK